MNQLRNAALEAMARAIWNEHFGTDSMWDAFLKAPPRTHSTAVNQIDECRRSADTALDALLALPGIRVVPLDATEEMLVAGTEDWLCVRAQEDRAKVIWSAMLAAAPNLLAGDK